MNRILIPLGLVALCACAAPTWNHASKDQQEFYRDSSQCMAMSGSGQPNQIAMANNPFAQGFNQGSAMAASQSRQTIYQQCMFGNGWHLSR